MKTKSLILIVALLSIATLTFSQSTAEKVIPSFSVKISLKCALQDPYLVIAMHEQLKPGFLNSNVELDIYTAVVKYHHTRYVIYGTYDEWLRFFAEKISKPKNNV